MRIHCFVKKDKNLFVARSLEFGLSAQSQNSCDAVEKLEEQIISYVDEIKTLNNEIKKVDFEYRKELINKRDCLLNFKACREFYWQYKWIAIKNKLYFITEYTFELEVNIYD